LGHGNRHENPSPSRQFGRGDQQIKSALHSYQEDHPAARIDLYRQNPASVRIRIIDPDFAGMSRVDRHARVWKYLDQLPEEDEGDIRMLVLLTPDEMS
jgi:stress-induced morphogen